MKVRDPGHEYELAVLDGEIPMILTFVKREGEKYPGNIGHYSGTTLQEVIRACIDRVKYLNNQEKSVYNVDVIGNLKECLVSLEDRASELHGRAYNSSIDIWDGNHICPKCLHVGCESNCQKGD